MTVSSAVVSKTPEVSVCGTTYNYERCLRRCIDSVRAQTFSDWEPIICDDWSDDDTNELLSHYAALDLRIKCIRSERRLDMW
jgi:glycosyltransferase involved in cell wall biosynthesis